MKLELASFLVKDVKLGRQTSYNNGVLEIDKEELLTLVLEDKKIASADLDVAFPGEQTRIVNIRDVVEPRVKVSGPGCIFPGIMGPLEPAGEGRTHRLSGVTVIASVQYRPKLTGGTGAQVSGLIDMWGPGSVVSLFGSTINIVLTFKLIDDVSETEAHTAIQSAEFKVAQRLAEATRQATPENVECFDLFKVDSSLPRVVYIWGVVTEWHHPCPDVSYYGLPIRESLPTLVHPNELLDGALTTDTRRGGGTKLTTWHYLNHPVVFRLLREHGNRLNFLGVILQRTRFEAEHGKHVISIGAAQISKLLGADGAIVTRVTTSGNNFIDTMLTVQACEKKEVKVVLVTPEWGGKGGTELPLVFYVPEAIAMVTTGSFDRQIEMPKPTKVIGVEEGQLVRYQPQDTPYSPWNELRIEGHHITGGIDWWGGMHQTCKMT